MEYTNNNESNPKEEDLDAEEPAFIDINSKDVIEVETNDQEPMEEEPIDATKESHTMDTDMEEKVLPPDHSILTLSTHTDSVYTVALDLEQDVWMASGGGDDKAFLHRIVSSNEVPSMNLSELSSAEGHKDTVTCVAFNTSCLLPNSNQSKLLAVGCYDGTIQIWTLTSNPPIHSCTLEGPSDIEWISFHPKGGSVLLAGSTDGTVWMYHIPTQKCLQVFVGHEGDVTCGRFTPDGKFALTAGFDGTVRVWAPRTGLSRHVFRCSELETLGEGGGMAITCLDGKSVAHTSSKGEASVSSLILCGGENGVAHICHVGTKKILLSLRHAEEERTTSASPMEQEDDFPQDTRSIEAVGFFEGPESSGLYNWCATAGVNGLLKVWDLGNNGSCRQICLHESYNSTPLSEKDHETPLPDLAGITRLKWHPSLPLIFTSTTEGTIRLWDARTGNCLTTLTGGSLEIINDFDIALENDGDNTDPMRNIIVSTASDDGKIRVYKVDIQASLEGVGND